jgi:hypothetical protein
MKMKNENENEKNSSRTFSPFFFHTKKTCMKERRKNPRHRGMWTETGWNNGGYGTGV